MNTAQLKHRVSRVEQWIEEQHSGKDDEHDDEKVPQRDIRGESPDGGSQSSPYLPYPHRSLSSIRTEQCDNVLVNEVCVSRVLGLLDLITYF
jgi:hypothetical protein